MRDKKKDEEPKQLSCRFQTGRPGWKEQKHSYLEGTAAGQTRTCSCALHNCRQNLCSITLTDAHTASHGSRCSLGLCKTPFISWASSSNLQETHNKVITARREPTWVISLAFCRHLSTPCCKHWTFQKNPQLIPKFSGQPLLADPRTHTHTRSRPGERGHSTPDPTLPCQDSGLTFF